MAVPKRKNEYLGLKNLDVLVEDTVFDSQYFRVLECPVILTQGKSSFLIGGSSDLKSGVEVKIELVNNNTDETIYIEPIRGHLEGDLRRVSIEVYNDVTPGAYTLYVVGELDPATSGVSIPPEWTSPAATEAHVVNPPICTGLEYEVVFPTPNCPTLLIPTAHAVPSVFLKI